MRERYFILEFFSGKETDDFTPESQQTQSDDATPTEGLQIVYDVFVGTHSQRDFFIGLELSNNGGGCNRRVSNINGVIQEGASQNRKQNKQNFEFHGGIQVKNKGQGAFVGMVSLPAPEINFMDLLG
jgi:hypothetical protein